MDEMPKVELEKIDLMKNVIFQLHINLKYFSKVINYYRKFKVDITELSLILNSF